MSGINPIAFYLPQFYPIPENDEWWGPGFTEWTNVAKAKPLFRGHYQPRIPGELSFYDLRVPEVRERQVALARIAGIKGFCYWHYWFSGRRLLHEVFDEVVATGKPDYPFCLCWANHSWFAKTWDAKGGGKLLIEQQYLGVEDYKKHFFAMLPAFRDERYIKKDGKLLFGIFDATRFNDFKLFRDTWNSLALENGIPSFHFFALVQRSLSLGMFDRTLYDSIVLDVMCDTAYKYDKHFLSRKYRNFKVNYLHRPYTVSYKDYVNEAISLFAGCPEMIPCLNPDFDHSPRSSERGIIFKNSSPDLFAELCDKICTQLKSNSKELLFIKSWNEWGEGNYLEPDMKWGRAYIDAMGKVMRNFSEAAE